MVVMYIPISKIPVSLHNVLSKKLIGNILDNEKRNISPELIKKIIYLWRQDQLASPEGIKSLIDASVQINPDSTFDVLETLGLGTVVASIRG